METIKEFAVGISYDVDQGSIRQAEQGFDSTGLSVKQLQQAVETLTKAMQGMVKQLTETAGKPTRDIQNTGRQIKDTWELLRKGALQWGVTTSAVTGAFVKSMQEVAKQYTDLYYLSARSGVSVQALKAMDNASKELGGSAGDATSAVANLHDQFQKYPGTQAKFREMTAGYAEAVRANMKMDQQQWNSLDQGTKDYAEAVRALKDLPAAQREVWAREWFGWNYEQTQKAIAQSEEWEKSTAHNIDTMNKFGLTQEKQEAIAKEAVKVQGEWNRLWNDLGGIFTQAFGEFGPKLEKTLEFLDKIVVAIGEFNKKVPGAATVEIFAGMAISTWGIAKAIEKITGFKILPSWLGGAKKGSDELKGKVGGIQDALKKVCDEKCAGLSEGLGEAGKKAEGLTDKLKKAGETYKNIADVASKSPSAGVLLGQGAATAQTIALTQEFLKKSEKMAPEEYARYTTGGRGELAEKFWGSLGMGQEKLARQQAERLAKSEDEGERQMGTTWLAQTEEQRRQAFADREAARKTKENAEKEAEAKGEKKEPGKYGELVGGLVGGFAGRAAGATLGTAIFPGLGSAAGGLAGGVAGSALGAWLGGKTGFQEGGIVQADLHHGEMVLPKNISQGMQKLFARGGQAEQTEKTMNRVAGLAMTVAQKLAPAAMGPVFGQANATLRLIQILEKGIEEAREDPKGLANPERGQALWNRYTGGSQIGEFPGMIGGKESQDADRRLSGWLGGIGGAPKVVLDNVEEFAREFVQALLRKQGAGAAGEGAGGVGGGAGGGGAGAGEGAPAATAGGRAGAAVGGAVGGAMQAIEQAITGPPQEVGKGQADPLAAIIEGESGGRNLAGGTSTTPGGAATSAAGYFQFLKGTWEENAKALEQKYGMDILSKYPTADAAPKNVQYAVAAHLYNTKGFQPWKTDPRETLTKRTAGQEFPKFVDPRQYLAQGETTGGPVSPGYGPGAYGEKGGGKVNANAAGGVDKDLVAATTAGFNSVLPEGYTAKISSGYRPGDPRYHGSGMAVDFKIYGPDSKEIPNRGSDTSGLYHKGYVASMAHMMTINPQKAGDMGWGGHFPIPGTNTPDIMHIDLGGQRGRYSNAKEFAAERAQAAALAKSMGGAKQTEVASAQMGGIIPNIMGGIMPLLAHAGEMVLPKELSQGLQRMISAGDAIGGMERMGALGLGGGVTNRTNNVTFNQTNNTNIASALTGGAQAGTISRFRDAHERIYGDLVRNFRAALA